MILVISCCRKKGLLFLAATTVRKTTITWLYVFLRSKVQSCFQSTTIFVVEPVHQHVIRTAINVLWQLVKNPCNAKPIRSYKSHDIRIRNPWISPQAAMTAAASKWIKTKNKLIWLRAILLWVLTTCDQRFYQTNQETYRILMSDFETCSIFFEIAWVMVWSFLSSALLHLIFKSFSLSTTCCVEQSVEDRTFVEPKSDTK